MNLRTLRGVLIRSDVILDLYKRVCPSVRPSITPELNFFLNGISGLDLNKIASGLWNHRHVREQIAGTHVWHFYRTCFLTLNLCLIIYVYSYLLMAAIRIALTPHSIFSSFKDKTWVEIKLFIRNWGGSIAGVPRLDLVLHLPSLYRKKKEVERE